MACDECEIEYCYENSRIRKIMTLNREKMQHVCKQIELMSKGELHNLQGCFRKQTSREDI